MGRTQKSGEEPHGARGITVGMTFDVWWRVEKIEWSGGKHGKFTLVNTANGNDLVLDYRQMYKVFDGEMSVSKAWVNKSKRGSLDPKYEKGPWWERRRK